jgi:REP element-mobilizing transposase RayT
MSNKTYIRVYHHLAWATKNREPLIAPEFRDKLHQYIGGIMTNIGSHVIAVGGTENHIHIFFCIQKMHDISEIVRCIKANSSQFIRYNNNSKFAWQNGYGWFSCTNVSIDGLKKYILNQENHHKKQSFDDEMLQLLKM